MKIWKIYKSIKKEFELFLSSLFLSFDSLKTPTVTVLFHISDSESSEWRIFGEGLTAHWLGFMVTKAESALLMAFDSSLVALPVLLPIFNLICSNCKQCEQCDLVELQYSYCYVSRFVSDSL